MACRALQTTLTIMSDLKQEFLGLSDKWFNRLTARVEGLTDEEYFWEPVPDCWTLVPGDDGKLNMRWGRIFDELQSVTTIAWRYTHIIDLLCEERCATYLGLEPETENIFANAAPPDVATARRMLDEAFARWKRYVSATDYDRIFEPVGTQAGPFFANQTRFTFVLHILDEAIHHGAEIGVLRDLYANERAYDPELSKLLRGEDVDEAALERIREEHPDLLRTAAATARWEAIPRLVNLGFDVGTEGRTAVHHAAAEGRVDLLKLLLEAGGSAVSRDPIYNATPVVWAEFFNQTEAAEFLKSHP
jgi:hypothetical protein